MSIVSITKTILSSDNFKIVLLCVNNLRCILEVSALITTTRLARVEQIFLVGLENFIPSNSLKPDGYVNTQKNAGLELSKLLTLLGT